MVGPLLPGPGFQHAKRGAKGPLCRNSTSVFRCSALHCLGVNFAAASQLPFLEGVGGWVSENKLDCLDPTMLHYVKLLLLHRHQLRTSMTNVTVNVSLGLSDKSQMPPVFFDRTST